MMPYFQRYGHNNYCKWGTIYTTGMKMLPREIEQEMLNGNSVVKIGSGMFNQVSADQSQEWLNGTGKKGGRIIGITKNVRALSRWALSFNLRSQMSKQTKDMLDIDVDKLTPHKEENLSRMKDSEVEDNIRKKLEEYNIFANDVGENL